MNYFVYILQCADGSLYTGCTNDLAKRIAEHNASKRGARYTKTRRPATLVHTERFRTLAQARRREHEIKSWPRVKKLDLIGK